MTTATAPEAPATPVEPMDEFGQAALSRAKTLIEQHNAKANVLKAAQGDEQATLDALRENPPTDEAKKYVDAISDLLSKVYALEEKRDAILKPLVAEQMESAKSGSEGVQAEVDDLKKKIKAATSYIKELYGPEHLTDLPSLTGVRAPSTGSGGGTGARRVRGFDVWVDGTLATSRNGEGVQVSNLAAAAKIMGISTEDARTAFFAAAGGDDSKKWGAEVTFTVTNDGKNYDVVAKKVNEGQARVTEDAAASDSAAEAPAEG